MHSCGTGEMSSSVWVQMDRQQVPQGHVVPEFAQSSVEAS